MNAQKRVAAIHDISGIGKCSLTVALPVLSAAGLETAVIPTAILSTHTGGFTDYTYRDLTDDIAPMAAHWKQCGFHFDALYTGFLGSVAQIDIVLDVIKQLRSEDTLMLVDPVMADNGQLYKTFEKSYPEYMKRLCGAADIITPNITEACLMTAIEYRTPPYDRDYIEQLLRATAKLCSGKVLLTGVCFEQSKLGCAAIENGSISYAFAPRVEGVYHGTGDVFCSTLLACLMNECPLQRAMELAAQLTANAIKRTIAEPTARRYGVNFESQLPWLISKLKLFDK